MTEQMDVYRFAMYFIFAFDGLSRFNGSFYDLLQYLGQILVFTSILAHLFFAFCRFFFYENRFIKSLDYVPSFRLHI